MQSSFGCESSVICSTENWTIRYVPCASTDIVVVTFASLDNQVSAEKARSSHGFAESFLLSEGLAGVHIIPHSNDWYLYPEAKSLLSVLAPVLSKYKKVVNYGASMGAYGAIKLSGQTNATTVIAVSPQAAICPEKIPFDWRWAPYQREIKNILDDDIAADVSGRIDVIFDSGSVDDLHARMIARKIPNVRLISFLGGGHAVLGSLAEVGMIRNVIIDLIYDRFDPDVQCRLWRRLRRQSVEYWVSLSYRGKWLPRKLFFAREAQKRKPMGAHYIALAAGILMEMGRNREAAVELRKAIALDSHVKEWEHLLRVAEAAISSGSR